MKQIALFLFVTIVTLAACHGCGRDESASPPAADAAPVPEPATTPTETTPMPHAWPFKDAPNTAVISLTRIMEGSNPVLYVVHDEDGDWQFLDGGDVSDEDATMISLKNMVEHDPSLRSLADLPVGWAAERAGAGQEWQRFER